MAISQDAHAIVHAISDMTNALEALNKTIKDAETRRRHEQEAASRASIEEAYRVLRGGEETGAGGAREGPPEEGEKQVEEEKPWKQFEPPHGRNYEPPGYTL